MKGGQADKMEFVKVTWEQFYNLKYDVKIVS